MSFAAPRSFSRPAELLRRHFGGDSEFRPGNCVELLESGVAYFPALIAAIEQARDIEFVLNAKAARAIKLDLPPELQLRADQSVAYRYVAQTLADASKAGLGRIGFVSEPETSP